MPEYKVGIYVRESRDDNDENYETIETQRDLLIDFVLRNGLGEVAGVYIDNNVSGTGFERDGLKQLEHDVKSKNIDMLLLKDLSRLGRNNAKTLLFLDFLEEYGIRVLTTDGRYDSSKDNDMVGIETWFNERYAKDISRKIRANLKFKISKGEYIGHAPYGYKKSPESKNRLIVDGSKAGVVRKIFEMYKQGYGYSYIARYLNLQGCLPPSAKNMANTKKDGWNPVAVQRILANRVYIGDTVQGVSEKVSFKSKKTRRLPEHRWVITENTHEAIIDRNDFEEVQRIREGKVVKKLRHKGKINLFSSLLFCGGCGSMMYARKRKDSPTAYVCSNYAKNGTKKCSSHHVYEEELLGILYDELKCAAAKEDISQNAAALAKDYFLMEMNFNKIDEIEATIEEKTRQQDVLYLDKLEGKIGEQQFLRINNEFQSQINALKNEITASQKRLDAANIANIGNLLKNLEIGDINLEAVKLMVEKIIVFDNGDKVDKIYNNDEICFNDMENKKNSGLIVIYFNTELIST
ncbi:MAG TPA: recombinase family protein [Pseudobacteroides sp.]|uniref:recombinase family protein n=1 Tax=Pseudobacteroides sp. TaxID=1968840 RepID=UPI002F922BC7